ncbi:flavin reductase (DIM6/NTAB) family NADH-FMN oxidoreductase RutF [Sphingobium sp. OAS761]|uniref:flavin reductase family protein n=1 Tax=Sphingobium sp. OAS761 TaxID=2817901 RepID=UPI00209D40E0|nr:flavin reductase family protein [Sphingobium sp. OAS761]MCP1471738.1 flavin reductase (DIM6/NTAB) family NADH-FMN oxidoreductase RutF [Sphingobium sp. OAS761]
MTDASLQPVPVDDVVVGLKGAMRRLASGVAIIAALGDDAPVGMAATSITSLTMDPPAILVCVNRSASIHAHLSAGCPISINLLSRHQREVSAAFGGAVARELRFGVGSWSRDHHDLPILEEAQANLSCTIDSLIPYGTHSIVIARVEAVRIGEAVDPLIFQDGAYL